MSNWHDLWQQQCRVWLDSINRAKNSGQVQYDFDQHRLTLVPRSCYHVDSDTMDIPYIQLKPLMSTMDSALMEYEIRMDASYRLAPTITVDRIHIYLDGAEAITQLALIVENHHIRLNLHHINRLQFLMYDMFLVKLFHLASLLGLLDIRKNQQCQ